MDGLSEDVDDLVQAATAYRPGQRLSSVDEFLELLEIVEDSLTAPAQAAAATEAPAEEDDDTAADKDPLEAVAGDVFGQAGGRSAAASAPAPPAAPSSSATSRPKPAGPARWPC